MKKKRKKLAALGLSLLLTASLFAGCNAQSGSQPESSLPPSEIPAESEPVNLPEIDYAPLTGLPLSDGQVKNQRPVAVMVGNSEVSLPQSGIAGADVIYEMVTEGGITRLMAVFSNAQAVGRVGSVRSIRDQFVQQLLPLNAVGVHIGESIYAREMLRQYAYPTVNGFYLGTLAFQFDEARDAVKANVHCWYTDAALIAQGMSLNEMPADADTVDALFQFLKPEEAPRVPAQKEALAIAFRFSGASDASFVYDPQTKMYLKSQFSAPQIDEATGAQLAFTNVLVLTTRVTLKPDGDCTEFDFTSGKGWYFSNGGGEEITWKKGDPDQKLKVYGQDGKELLINCGKSYVAIVDTEALQNSLTVTGPQAPAASSAE